MSAILCRWIAPLVFFLTLASSAQAGYYQIAYSCDSGITTTNGTSATNPYALDGNGGYGGQGSIGWGYGSPGPSSGSASCQGGITATFTWQASSPDDLPPDSVVVQEDSSVRWTGQANGGSVTGNCANGLGSPVVSSSYPSQGGSSTGTTYQVKQNPGSSFTISCSPSASVSGSSPGYGGGFGTVYLTFRATATPVMIVAAETNGKSVLIGQEVGAFLETGNSQQSNWQWSVSGADPFAGFQVMGNSGQALELTAAMKSQATFNYYYRSTSGGSDSTVSCTVTLTFPDGTQQQASASTKLTVAEPAHSLTTSTGTVNVQIINGVLRLAPFNPATGQGIRWNGSVTTPSEFIGEQGAGLWCLAQIITPTYVYADMNGTIHRFGANGQTGLDGAFPYPSSSFPADGTSGLPYDTPGIPLDNKQAADIAGTFKTYMLYQPPAYDSNSHVTWVPLHEVDWNFHGAANFVNGAWQLTAQNGINITQDAKTITLPFWTQIITFTNF